MTTQKKFQTILSVFLLSTITFFGGYYVGKRGYLIDVVNNPPQITVVNQNPGDMQIDFALFWEVWDVLSKNYLERPLDPQKLYYGAISGMVSSVGDPYTSFLTPELNKAVLDSINGTYQGIGAELDIQDSQLIVVAPLDGSPALAAGVKAGDKILKIEDENTFGITLTEAVTRIRGDAGSVIALTLQRGDDEPFVVRIKRGVITVKSVTWEDKGNGTVYVRISTFGGDTNRDWEEAMSQIKSSVKELDSVVLDLRGNPGGYLQSAVYIAEEFFSEGVVIYEENAQKEQTKVEARRRNGIFESVPGIFVLIDRGSASASEILAATLKSNREAVLVGEKSYGKGTIQDAKNFSDGSGIHITIAKWLTPDKQWVHDVGISPDVEVKRTSEDFNNNVDPQLDVVLDLANKL